MSDLHQDSVHPAWLGWGSTWMIAAVLGFVPVIAFFLAGWWLAFLLLPEAQIPFYAFGGLGLGVLMDILFLRGLVKKAYTLRPGLWMGIYVFYSVGVFGMFMGLPVPDLFLAVPAGLFVGWKLALGDSGVERKREIARKTARFTCLVLAMICALSASIALRSPSTPRDIEGMCRLPFHVTHSMLLGLIVIGAASLLSVCWMITIKSVEVGVLVRLKYGRSLKA